MTLLGYVIIPLDLSPDRSLLPALDPDAITYLRDFEGAVYILTGDLGNV